MDEWQLILKLDFAVVGVRCGDSNVDALSYLPPSTASQSAKNSLAQECAQQLEAYCRNPQHRFDLPLAPALTVHQRRVRTILQTIAPGEMMTYGEVATRLQNSSPRAIGGACRANPIALIVPCHRVVAINGLGGFSGSQGNSRLSLLIKEKLLQHEGVL